MTNGLRALRAPMLGLFVLLAGTIESEASLIDLGGGMIYDDVLDITWLQNANQGGSKNRAAARTWAADLVFGGFDDWRLATTDVNGDGVATGNTPHTPDNEFAWMFYHNLGGSFFQNKTGTQVSVDGITFTNIQARHHGDDRHPSTGPIVFVMSDGGQFFQTAGTALYGAWAVRDGGAPVPEASTALLGALGLIGLAIRRRGLH